jgi:hypothetical protein
MKFIDLDLRYTSLTSALCQLKIFRRPMQIWQYPVTVRPWSAQQPICMPELCVRQSCSVMPRDEIETDILRAKSLETEYLQTSIIHIRRGPAPGKFSARSKFNQPI